MDKAIEEAITKLIDEVYRHYATLDRTQRIIDRLAGIHLRSDDADLFRELSTSRLIEACKTLEREVRRLELVRLST